MHFEKPELKDKLDTEIIAITQNKEPMGLKEIAEQLIAARAEEKGIEKGIEQGIQKGKSEKDILFVTNLLQSTDFTIEKIATLADVSPEFVQQLRIELGK